MKLFKLFLLSSVFVAAFSTSVNAMDLAGMQGMALSNRQVIRQFVTALEQSKQDIVRARGGYYPSVDLSYAVNALDEPALTEDDENSIIYGGISYNLFKGFRDKYNIRSAELLDSVKEFQLQGIKQDVQLNVALAYLAVYERLANKKVAQSAFQTLEKVYKDGESRFEVGLIGKNELLKFRVDYDNADITVKTAEAGLKKSINSLSRQVGSQVDFSELDFKEFDTLPKLVDRDDYRLKMLNSRNEIKALEALMEVSSAQVEAEKSGYYPQLDLVGSYRKYDNDYFNGNGDVEEDELRAQLLLSINLFRGFTTEATVAKAKLETRSQQYELDELKDTLNNELDNLFIDFEVNLENVEVANRSIEQAEENLRITQLKYDEGLQRESDLLDAITSLSRAQYNYVAVVRTTFLNDFQLTRIIDGF